MSNMAGMMLTNVGKQILALAILGQPLHFTKAIVGDGELVEGQDPAELEAVMSPRHEMTFTGIRTTQQLGAAELTAEMHNEDIVEGFYVREYGLYVTHPTSQQEVLYAYCNKGGQSPYIEAFNGTDPIVFTFTFCTVIKDAPNVTAQILRPQEYVSHTRFDQRMMDILALLSGMNDRVISLTAAVLELSRAEVWSTRNMVRMRKVDEELRSLIDKNTSATLEITRNLVWDASHTIKTEKRLEALEGK